MSGRQFLRNRWLPAFSISITLAAPVVAQVIPAPPPSISVNGRAEISAAPDRVQLSVAVETEAAQAAAAVEENTRRSKAVIDALKALISGADRVTTTSYSVQPRYNVGKPGEAVEPKIVGYTASNSVMVESARIELAGKLIDAAISAGANRINNLSFTLADRAPHLRNALDQAGKEARAQAESISGALGVRLGKVLSASVNSMPAVQYKRMEYQMMDARAGGAPPPIEAGDVTVTADLQVAYEILP